MRSTISTSSPEESVELGMSLGRKLGPGDVVALYGELGSGKTTLIRGICRSFSVGDWVKSPSFVLVREYPGRIPIYHIDLYRIEGDQFPDLEEYLELGGIVLIEWAEKVEDRLPEQTIRVYLRIAGQNLREIEIVDPRS
ncbi:tRNA (adenosine(37)-N6)-threonylcarbamoyltransferase complex ATPase subunit type 1 TsaE [candidate division WOR-3 bacterium]|uniref:tRNA threonylcarbamoyladenosine biosynthesis protein TsaE n=1 Tax=candidate division WOR-3 bacterium TaxID=2052148 RepID=A0A660SHU0_UNCW3|nr:MAG: tRNA (adenosine(37)-N6)-threonylcarbamoyltransferase complex ATPase subunit type 1 TsaE [candidate division WOR-3 bacterium]